MADRISLAEAVRRLTAVTPSFAGARRDLLEALRRQRLDAFSDDVHNVAVLLDHEMVDGIADPIAFDGDVDWEASAAFYPPSIPPPERLVRREGTTVSVEQFETLWPAAKVERGKAAPARRRRGRPPGTGWRRADAPHFERMRDLSHQRLVERFGCRRRMRGQCLSSSGGWSVRAFATSA